MGGAVCKPAAPGAPRQLPPPRADSAHTHAHPQHPNGGEKGPVQRAEGSRTHRCLGYEAAQLGLEAAHGPGGGGAEAQIGVPLRGAPDEQRQRLLHGGTSTGVADTPTPGPAEHFIGARRAPPCRRVAVAATDWPRRERGDGAFTWANGTEPRLRGPREGGGGRRRG